MREPVVLERDHRLLGVLHRPEDSNQCPAILVCHGYAGTKIGSRRLYVELAERLELCQIATLRLDFSGCGDSEGRFEDLAMTDLVQDALCGLDYLRRKCQFSQIGLLGASLGGAIATLAAQADGEIRSLALWAAVASGQMWSDDWARHFPKQVVNGVISCGGTQSGARFREQFLAFRADQILEELQSVPLYHAQAGADYNVRSGHAELIRKARQKSSARSQFTLLPESGHSFVQAKERNQMVDETVKWFADTLGGCREDA